MTNRNSSGSYKENKALSGDKEPSDKEPSDKEPSDKEPSDKEPSDEEPVCEETADKGRIDEGRIDEETADKGTAGKATVGKATAGKATAGKATAGKELDEELDEEPPNDTDPNDPRLFGSYTTSRFKVSKLLYIIPIVLLIMYYTFRTAMSISYLLFFISLFYNDRYPMVLKSIKTNFIFWIFIIISVFILSIKYGQETHNYGKIVSGLLTLIISMFMGWYIHYFSHTFNFRKIFNIFLEKTAGIFDSKLTNPISFILKDIGYFGCDIFDFHSKIHHNPKLNKLWYNRVIEFLQNIITISIPLIYLCNTYNICTTLSSNSYYLNKTIAFLWGILYTTNHNINYAIIEPEVHKEHHIKDISHGMAYNDLEEKVPNLGWPDTIDIICNSKYKTNIIENYNHCYINIIIVTVIIIIIKESKLDFLKKFSKYV